MSGRGPSVGKRCHGNFKSFESDEPISDTIAPMATRTSLRVHEPEAKGKDSNLPAVRPDDMRRHLPGIEPTPVARVMPARVRWR